MFDTDGLEYEVAVRDAYILYVTENASRLREGWVPVCFPEFLESEELHTYLAESRYRDVTARMDQLSTELLHGAYGGRRFLKERKGRGATWGEAIESLIEAGARRGVQLDGGEDAPGTGPEDPDSFYSPVLRFDDVLALARALNTNQEGNTQ